MWKSGKTAPLHHPNPPNLWIKTLESEYRLHHYPWSYVSLQDNYEFGKTSLASLGPQAFSYWLKFDFKCLTVAWVRYMWGWTWVAKSGCILAPDYLLTRKLCNKAKDNKFITAASTAFIRCQHQSLCVAAMRKTIGGNITRWNANYTSTHSQSFKGFCWICRWFMMRCDVHTNIPVVTAGRELSQMSDLHCFISPLLWG